MWPLGFIQNAEECNCCQDIDKCMVELQSEQGLLDTDGAVCICITDHPGFAEVCLEEMEPSMCFKKISYKRP